MRWAMDKGDEIRKAMESLSRPDVSLRPVANAQKVSSIFWGSGEDADLRQVCNSRVRCPYKLPVTPYSLASLVLCCDGYTVNRSTTVLQDDRAIKTIWYLCAEFAARLQDRGSALLRPFMELVGNRSRAGFDSCFLSFATDCGMDVDEVIMELDSQSTPHGTPVVIESIPALPSHKHELVWLTHLHFSHCDGSGKRSTPYS